MALPHLKHGQRIALSAARRKGRTEAISRAPAGAARFEKYSGGARACRRGSVAARSKAVLGDAGAARGVEARVNEISSGIRDEVVRRYFAKEI